MFLTSTAKAMGLKRIIRSGTETAMTRVNSTTLERSDMCCWSSAPDVDGIDNCRESHAHRLGRSFVNGPNRHNGEGDK